MHQHQSLKGQTRLILLSSQEGARKLPVRLCGRAAGKVGIMKIVACNKTQFAAEAALVLLFNGGLLFGVRRIYESESEWHHRRAESQLLAGRLTIQYFGYK